MPLLTTSALLTSMTIALPPDPVTQTAEYQLTFQATWSAQTHPGAYPSGAHFSPLIGGTHHDAFSFWSEGQLATNGIESMAETGSKNLLRTEVLNAIIAGDAEFVVEDSGGIGSPGQTTITFTASLDHPHLTLVTMIAPSPDWFVGTEGLRLLGTDDRWAPELTVELLPYDSGTDSGANFTSPNTNTNPAEPIAEIRGFPFSAPGIAATSLGTFTLTRINPPVWRHDLDDSGLVNFTDLIILLGQWGDCPECRADFSGNDAVDFDDLTLLLSSWEQCD